MGTALNVAGLVALLEAATVTGLTVAFLVALLGQGVALAAYEALMPEVVPPSAWGRASGSMGVATLLGSIVGLVTSGALGAARGILAMIVTVAGAAVLTAFIPERAGVPLARPGPGPSTTSASPSSPASSSCTGWPS